jgi:hypothetical protein
MSTMSTLPPLVARPIAHGWMERTIGASTLAFGDEATLEFVKGLAADPGA